MFGAPATVRNMLVARSQPARDLENLGLVPGGVAMVHCRMSALGRVVGGAETVVRALLDASPMPRMRNLPCASRGLFYIIGFKLNNSEIVQLALCNSYGVWSGSPEPCHPIYPILLPVIPEYLLHARDEAAEGLVSNAGGNQDHPCVRASLAGPVPQDRLEVTHVGRYQDASFGRGKLEDFRV